MNQKYNHQIRVTGILIEDNKLLIVKQRVNDRRPWSLPGGRMEQGETIGQAVLREMEEETGLVISIQKLLYLCDVPGDHPVVHVTFLLERASGEIRLPSNEYDENPISDVRFVEIRDLEQYGFLEEFIRRVEAGFPDAGNYMGSKANIGLM